MPNVDPTTALALPVVYVGQFRTLVKMAVVIPRIDKMTNICQAGFAAIPACSPGLSLRLHSDQYWVVQH